MSQKGSGGRRPADTPVPDSFYSGSAQCLEWRADGWGVDGWQTVLAAQRPADGERAVPARRAELPTLAEDSARSPAALEAALDLIEGSLLEDFRSAAPPTAEAERIATALGRADLVMRARLIAADIQGRRGDVAELGKRGRIINAWAYEHRHTYLIARSHRLLSIFFRRVGDAGEALAHALRCVEHTTEDMAPRIRAGHYMTLALVLDINGSYSDARERFNTALAIAGDDPAMSLAVLNNMAYTAYEIGDEDAAVGIVERMRAIGQTTTCSSTGSTWTRSRGWSCCSSGSRRWRRRCGRCSRTRHGPLDTDGDVLPTCLVTAAEALRRRGPARRGRRPRSTRRAALRRARVAGRRCRGAAPAGRDLRRREGAFRKRTRSTAATMPPPKSSGRPSGRPGPARCRPRSRPRRLAGTANGTASSPSTMRSPGCTTAGTSTSSSPRSSALGGRASHADVGRARSTSITSNGSTTRSPTRSATTSCARSARCWSAAVPPPGIAARLGGEEFVLVLPDTSRSHGRADRRGGPPGDPHVPVDGVDRTAQRDGQRGGGHRATGRRRSRRCSARPTATCTGPSATAAISSSTTTERRSRRYG